VRTGPHTVKVTLAGSPADPLIVGAPHIDWNLTITIDMTNPKAPMYSITGKHDDYPDHEIYINGVQVYFRHGTSILDLFGGGDVTVSAFGPIAP
jgi:hypothetical protein